MGLMGIILPIAPIHSITMLRDEEQSRSMMFRDFGLVKSADTARSKIPKQLTKNSPEA